MIFPILNLFFKFKRTPITWVLFFMNLFVMLLGTGLDINSNLKMSKVLEDKVFIEIQGSIYQSYLREKQGHQVNREMASVVEDDSRDNHQILGVLAFRDEQFFEAPIVDIPYPDEVALNYWKSKADSFLIGQYGSLSYLMGVNSSNYNPVAWLSYMFAHGSWGHFFSNMIFLLLVGSTLELCLGSLGLLIVFLFSGFIGCGVFILVSGLSAAPLIGASAAVSGLISMLAVISWNSPIRFVYWLILPRRDAFGFVYFPGYVLLLLWWIADLAGWLGSSSLFGGVAHSAHLGGHFAGLIAGLILLAMNRGKEAAFQPDPGSKAVEMYRLYPLLPYKEERV